MNLNRVETRYVLQVWRNCPKLIRHLEDDFVDTIRDCEWLAFGLRLSRFKGITEESAVKKQLANGTVWRINFPSD